MCVREYIFYFYFHYFNSLYNSYPCVDFIIFACVSEVVRMSHNDTQESVESQWEGVPIFLIFLILSISYSYYYVDISMFNIQRITFPVSMDIAALYRFLYYFLFTVIHMFTICLLISTCSCVLALSLRSLMLKLFNVGWNFCL